MQQMVFERNVGLPSSAPTYRIAVNRINMDRFGVYSDPNKLRINCDIREMWLDRSGTNLAFANFAFGGAMDGP